MNRQFLTDSQWAKIEPIIMKKLGNWGGGNAYDNRIFVNACLYIVKTKTPWYKLPPEYGKYKGINRRFNRWRNQHIWDDVLAILLEESDFDWLLIETPYQKTNEQQIPKFTMAWMKMVSPSKKLLCQVQDQIALKLSNSE